MPILKSPPRPPKNETLQIRIEEDIRSKLAKYAEFIDSGRRDVKRRKVETVKQLNQPFWRG